MRRAEGVYLAGAIPVRLAADGAGVALALLAAVELGDVALGGLLLAVLTAPSVIAAPLLGALLDSTRAPRRLMLVASVVYGGGLTVAASAAVLPLAVVVVALVVAGCVLPVFMGGLSAFVVEAMPGAPSRSFAVDALSYNLAGIGGPAVVAGVSALASPSTALLVLAGVVVAGGCLLQLLPIVSRGASARPADLLRGIGAAARHLTTHGPIARVVAAGAFVQIGGGAFPLVAVLVAVQRGAGEASGGWLISAFAAGGVVGALASASPWGSRALGRLPGARTMAGCFVITGLGILAAALVPGYAAALVALAIGGLAASPGIAAMLRLRQEESPAPVRAQVFVVAAGLRTVTTAIGAALAGAAAGLPPALLLGLIGIVWTISAPILLLHRRAPVATA